METALTKSFPTMKTGNLSYLSLIYGFVEPFNIYFITYLNVILTERSTLIAVNVKCPNFGI